jgi:hypothetical protein
VEVAATDGSPTAAEGEDAAQSPLVASASAVLKAWASSKRERNEARRATLLELRSSVMRERSTISSHVRLYTHSKALESRQVELASTHAQLWAAVRTAMEVPLTDDDHKVMGSFYASKAHETCAIGLRRYTPGQRLQVLLAGEGASWVDVEVVAAPKEAWSAKHALRKLDQQPGGGGQFELTLVPLNHAPREMPAASFNELRRRYYRTLRTQHASITDALSGRRLDVKVRVLATDTLPPTQRHPRSGLSAAAFAGRHSCRQCALAASSRVGLVCLSACAAARLFRFSPRRCFVWRVGRTTACRLRSSTRP